MNFMLFLIKFIMFKQRIKFKKFELHNYAADSDTLCHSLYTQRIVCTSLAADFDCAHDRSVCGAFTCSVLFAGRRQKNNMALNGAFRDSHNKNARPHDWHDNFKITPISPLVSVTQVGPKLFISSHCIKTNDNSEIWRKYSKLQCCQSRILQNPWLQTYHFEAEVSHPTTNLYHIFVYSRRQIIRVTPVLGLAMCSLACICIQLKQHIVNWKINTFN